MLAANTEPRISLVLIPFWQTPVREFHDDPPIDSTRKRNYNFPPYCPAW